LFDFLDENRIIPLKKAITHAKSLKLSKNIAYPRKTLNIYDFAQYCESKWRNNN
jgi:hypothetical protein